MRTERAGRGQGSRPWAAGGVARHGGDLREDHEADRQEGQQLQRVAQQPAEAPHPEARARPAAPLLLLLLLLLLAAAREAGAREAAAKAAAKGPAAGEAAAAAAGTLLEHAQDLVKIHAARAAREPAAREPAAREPARAASVNRLRAVLVVHRALVAVAQNVERLRGPEKSRAGGG